MTSSGREPPSPIPLVLGLSQETREMGDTSVISTIRAHQMRKLVSAFCIFALVSGCAVKNLSVEDRKQIRTIVVLPVQWSPDHFQYTSMKQAWGAGLGAGAGAAVGMASGASKTGTAALTGAGTVVGSKVAETVTLSDSAAILDNMKRSDIDLGKLVRKSLEERITRGHLFTVAQQGQAADAQIEIIVSSWGFSLKNYSSELYPVIGVVAVMKKGNTAIWRNFDTVSPFNDANTQAYLPQQYATDPETLRSALARVSDLVADKLVDRLKN